MGEKDLKFWLALKSVEGLGNAALRNLVKTFGSPRRAFRASMHELGSVAGIRRETTERIKSFNDWGRIEREMDLAEKSAVSIITLEDALYPRLLLSIADPPAFLYVKGDLKETDVPVAVVGSRAASAYGKFSTERLCRDLALNGLTVVSGMARGIDSAAHRGALSVKGRTIAVLGCGIDVVYPPENGRLYDEIASSGAVVTEFPFGALPLARNFPLRNRIISGLSLGVVVIEATDRSGSLITARLALEQGREVFAVPGAIDSPGSRGTHRLIKEGAKLVENFYDIIEEIRPQIVFSGAYPSADQEKMTSEGRTQSLNEDEKKIMGVLSEKAVDVETIIERTGLRANDALSLLLGLELKGRIEQQPGKIFVRKE